jgi:hypothetical protein
MLHQTVTQMYTSQRIACVNGPWWFVQMWLQLHMHQIVGVDLNTRFFPSSTHHEGEPQATRGCQTYGEVASTVLIQQNISQLFELFFRGFQNPLWLPYLDNDNLTLPCEFSFETERQDGRFLEIFNIIIRPCILSAEFSGGRLTYNTYEYYQPNMMARQLGYGQMTPRLFLHEFLNPERKSRNLLKLAEFFNMHAFLLFIPGLSFPQQ